MMSVLLGRKVISAEYQTINQLKKAVQRNNYKQWVWCFNNPLVVSAKWGGMDIERQFFCAKLTGKVLKTRWLPYLVGAF